MVKVSFNMGTRNGSTKLHVVLGSILNQTFQDFEIVICDDASTDDTLEILNEYKESYPDKFVILHNEKCLTVAGAVNRCIEVSKGEYIARIDDDDYCYPERLEKQVKFLDDNKDIDCVGSYMNVYDGNQVTGVRKIEIKPTIETLINGSYTFHNPTILIRTSVMRELNGYDNSEKYRRCEDLEFFYRFFENGYKGYNLDIPLLRYQENSLDYKRRKTPNIVKMVKVRKEYRKKLKYPFYKDFVYLKPLVFSLLPDNLRYVIKNKVLDKK